MQKRRKIVDGFSDLRVLSSGSSVSPNGQNTEEQKHDEIQDVPNRFQPQHSYQSWYDVHHNDRRKDDDGRLNAGIDVLRDVVFEEVVVRRVDLPLELRQIGPAEFLAAHFPGGAEATDSLPPAAQVFRVQQIRV